MQVSFTRITHPRQRKDTIIELFLSDISPRWVLHSLLFLVIHVQFMIFCPKQCFLFLPFSVNKIASIFVFVDKVNHIVNYYLEQNAARETVPGGPSVACSTAKAVEWDAAWSKNLDPSGRAALGVHAAAYEDASEVKTTVATDTPQKLEVDKAAVAV